VSGMASEAYHEDNDDPIMKKGSLQVVAAVLV
jgi:hypothetical protein